MREYLGVVHNMRCDIYGIIMPWERFIILNREYSQADVRQRWADDYTLSEQQWDSFHLSFLSRGAYCLYCTAAAEWAATASIFHQTSCWFRRQPASHADHWRSTLSLISSFTLKVSFIFLIDLVVSGACRHAAVSHAACYIAMASQLPAGITYMLIFSFLHET